MKIASYYTVQPGNVYEQTVEQKEMSWETWAYETQRGLDLSVVSETSTGTIVVHETTAKRVSEFKALSQRATASMYEAERKEALKSFLLRVVAPMAVVCFLGGVALVQATSSPNYEYKNVEQVQRSYETK